MESPGISRVGPLSGNQGAALRVAPLILICLEQPDVIFRNAPTPSSGRPRPLPRAAVAYRATLRAPGSIRSAPRLLGGQNARATSRRDPSSDYNSRNDYSRYDSVGANHGRRRGGARAPRR